MSDCKTNRSTPDREDVCQEEVSEYRFHVATTLNFCHAFAEAYRANATTAGVRSNSSTRGNMAHAVTVGVDSHASTIGYRSHAAATGHFSNAETVGNGSIAIAVGIRGRAKAQSGAIVIAEYDDQYRLIGVAAAMVGEHGVEPGVWYELRGGVIARCDDQEGGAA